MPQFPGYFWPGSIIRRSGKLTGKKIVEIASLDPNWYTTFQDGVENRYGVEKFSELKKRIKNFMASMKISGKDRVILTVFPDDYSKYSIIYRKKCIIE